MHEVLVNLLGGLSLPRKSVVRLTDRPNMALDVYRGRKTTVQLSSAMEKAFTSVLISQRYFVVILTLKFDNELKKERCFFYFHFQTCNGAVIRSCEQ